MPRIGWMRTDGFGWRICDSNGLKYHQTEHYNLLLISRASWTLMMPVTSLCDMASSIHNHHAPTTVAHNLDMPPRANPHLPATTSPPCKWSQPPKNDNNRPQDDHDRLTTTTRIRERGPEPTQTANDDDRPRMDDARGPRYTKPRMNPRAPGRRRGRVDEADDDDDDDGVVVVILNEWVSSSPLLPLPS